MKVLSSKVGSSRERVDAEAMLLPIANWRIAEGGARSLVLHSQFGTGERNAELWLTEAEAIGIARAVSEGLFEAAAKSAAVVPSKRTK